MMMSRIYEHFSNLINNFREPEYDKEYGDWYAAKQKELQSIDDKIENKLYDSRDELLTLEHKRAELLLELNGSVSEE